MPKTRSKYPVGAETCLAMEWQGGDTMVLLCPNCGGMHTHLDVVEILTPNDGVSVRAAGEDARAHVLVQEVEGRDDGRRHRVNLLLYCEECGHTMTIGCQQHKGWTLMTLHKEYTYSEPPMPPDWE